MSNERPKEKQKRKIMKYLCPICFRYFNEMLDCIECANYICMLCARGLIKQELRRTKQLQPPPETIKLSCPHCMSHSEEVLFQDIDKSKPLKIYTDSPEGTVIMASEFGRQEEFKVSVQGFKLG